MNAKEAFWVLFLGFATLAAYIHQAVPWADDPVLVAIQIIVGMVAVFIVLVAGVFVPMFAIYRHRHPWSAVGIYRHTDTISASIDECLYCGEAADDGYITRYYRELVLFGFAIYVVEFGRNEDCEHHYHYPLDAELDIESSPSESYGSTKHNSRAPIEDIIRHR